MTKKTEKLIKLQASSIHRIWNCPGSLYLNLELDEKYKFNPWSGKASYGSLLHDVAEKMLKDESLKLPALLKAAGLKTGSADYDKGMSTVKYYLKYIKKIEKKYDKLLAKKHGGVDTRGVEVKYRINQEGFDCVAKMDYFTMLRTKDQVHIDIFDLKTGHFNYEKSGIDQLLFSLFTILPEHFNIDDPRPVTYNLHIVQPNYWKDEEKVIVQTGISTIQRLTNMFKSSLYNIEVSNSSDITQGEHCKFCPAILTCPQAQGVAGFIDQMCKTHPEDMKDLSKEHLEYMFTHAEFFKDYLKTIEGVIGNMLENGETFNGIYTKPTSGKRTWKDPKKVIRKFKHLGEKMYEPRKLKSPAQLEVLAGKENVDGFTKKATFKKLVVGEPDNAFKDMTFDIDTEGEKK